VRAKKEQVRITVDVPIALHKKLKIEAATRRTTIRMLVIDKISNKRLEQTMERLFEKYAQPHKEMNREGN